MSVLPSWFRAWPEIRAMVTDAIFPERMLWRAMDQYLEALRALAAVETELKRIERIEGYARLIEVQELGT